MPAPASRSSTPGRARVIRAPGLPGRPRPMPKRAMSREAGARAGPHAWSRSWSTVTDHPDLDQRPAAVFRPEVTSSRADTKILVDQCRTIDPCYVAGALLDYLFLARVTWLVEHSLSHYLCLLHLQDSCINWATLRREPPDRSGSGLRPVADGQRCGPGGGRTVGRSGAGRYVGARGDSRWWSARYGHASGVAPVPSCDSRRWRPGGRPAACRREAKTRATAGARPRPPGRCTSLPQPSSKSRNPVRGAGQGFPAR